MEEKTTLVTSCDREQTSTETFAWIFVTENNQYSLLYFAVWTEPWASLQENKL